MRTARIRRTAGVAAIAVAALGACDRTGVTPNTEHSAQAPLNTASASDLMVSITRAGLPAPNARDMTTTKCPKLHCLSAIDSDTVSILKFPASGPAQLYAGSISNVYQVEDVVLTFGPTVTADRKRQYERVVDRAAS